ncbi:GLPGLI family protein [Chitinophaga costaii]|uniref:GLPGLI family protein n=1 Tax=Chitinophaga costaii TaxID=1335309 RepID=A0A1C4DAI8_9BACT|nr:GLPGLI family protein [Chitinophaga costaii]SCC28248.1 GLPGLI family protein [Chitinophaga costaii]
MHRKSILALVCTLLIQWNNSIAQKNLQQTFNNQIVYKIVYKPDSNDLTNIKSEDMELLTNDSMSLFRSVNTGMRDSAAYLPYINNNIAGIMKVLQTYRTSLYYNIVKTPSDISYMEEIISSTRISNYKEPKEAMHWELMADTLTINGLHCQKALLAGYGHRNWTAWFCNDIPISDGPYKFCGLPGLIVKIADEKEYWSFTLEGIANKHTHVIINYYKELPYTQIDKPTFFKDKKYFLFNGYQLKEAKGDFEGIDPQVKEKLKASNAKRAKEDNNWIELP